MVVRTGIVSTSPEANGLESYFNLLLEVKRRVSRAIQAHLEVPDFVGKHVKEADEPICARLKADGRLVHKEVHPHSYPFCWRSDTPLIYKAVPSW